MGHPTAISSRRDENGHGLMLLDIMFWEGGGPAAGSLRRDGKGHGLMLVDRSFRDGGLSDDGESKEKLA